MSNIQYMCNLQFIYFIFKIFLWLRFDIHSTITNYNCSMPLLTVFELCEHLYALKANGHFQASLCGLGWGTIISQAVSWGVSVFLCLSFLLTYACLSHSIHVSMPSMHPFVYCMSMSPSIRIPYFKCCPKFL